MKESSNAAEPASSLTHDRVRSKVFVVNRTKKILVLREEMLLVFTTGRTDNWILLVSKCFNKGTISFVFIVTLGKHIQRLARVLISTSWRDHFAPVW